MLKKFFNLSKKNTTVLPLGLLSVVAVVFMHACTFTDFTRIKDSVCANNATLSGPDTKADLEILIATEIEKQGNTANLNCIDTSAIIDMSGLFEDKLDFNGDIGEWDVSKVTDMSRMFKGHRYVYDEDLPPHENEQRAREAPTSAFNGDLSEWDVGNVKDMSYMFSDAYAFNGDISEWDVSKVTDMRSMFEGARVFNQNIGKWLVDNVTSMSKMFQLALAFNSDLSEWDVSKVTDMSRMFSGASAFNADLSKWDVGSVISMKVMFGSARAFNQDIGGWYVNKVTDMGWMFYNASVFNQDLSEWNVSNVTDMSWLFYDAKAFDQDLSAWDNKVAQVTNMRNMFFGSGMASNKPDWYDNGLQRARIDTMNGVQDSSHAITLCKDYHKATTEAALYRDCHGRYKYIHKAR